MSTRDEAILALGRKLVEELGMTQSVDTLGRWLAHYLAELIKDAEEAGEAEGLFKKEKCFNAILQLWDHRNDTSRFTKPFEGIESICKSLEHLIQDYRGPAYLSKVGLESISKSERADTSWGYDIESIDTAAKTLIKHCLKKLAEEIPEETSTWKDIVDKIEDVDPVEVRFIKILERFDSDPDKTLIQDLDHKISVLKIMKSRTDQLLEDLHHQRDVILTKNKKTQTK